MSIKWRYFTFALIISTAAILYGAIIDLATFFWVLPIMVLIAVVMMVRRPDQIVLGRFFMWGTLVSIPLTFIISIILMIASGVKC